MNSFNDWLLNKHPEFKIEESLLGALGNIALGAVAVGKTAIDRSRKYKNYDAKNYKNISTKTKNYVVDFLNQKWDWDKILKDDIIQFVYFYKTGEEKPTDQEFYPLIKTDALQLGNKISKKNRETKNFVTYEVAKKWLFENSKHYWNDDLINKFYESIKISGKNPEYYGGEDIRLKK